MGLIRSGMTELTPEDDRQMTGFLWPVVREIIKTAIENRQNLIVEGCYLPADWDKDFEKDYLDRIRCYCLVMSEAYIARHFDDIRRYANVIEQRLDDDSCTPEFLQRENAYFAEWSRNPRIKTLWIEEDYRVEIEE